MKLLSLASVWFVVASSFSYGADVTETVLGAYAQQHLAFEEMRTRVTKGNMTQDSGAGAPGGSPRAKYKLETLAHSTRQ